MRESEVVFRMYSKLGKNLYLLSLGPAEGDEGKLDLFSIISLALLLQQKYCTSFLRITSSTSLSYGLLYVLSVSVRWLKSLYYP